MHIQLKIQYHPTDKNLLQQIKPTVQTISAIHVNKTTQPLLEQTRRIVSTNKSFS